jgi:hypothetical protein
MVAGCGINVRLLKKVAEIYDWLDEQIRLTDDLVARCDSCGRCCDFEFFDHRLFVTPPELVYLAAHIGDKNMKPMVDSRCPYHLICQCTVYEYRFAGCRIFSCKTNADFQSRLSESALEKLKSICTEFQIPYRYTDLATALNNLAGV